MMATAARMTSSATPQVVGMRALPKPCNVERVTKRIASSQVETTIHNIVMSSHINNSCLAW